MRRGLLIAAVVVLVLTLALWVAARVEQSPLSRSHGNKRLPEVIAGRDGARTATAPVREAEEGGTVRCRFDGEGDPGKLAAMGNEGTVEGPEGELSLALPAGTWNLMWMQPDGGGTQALGTVDVEVGDVLTCTLGDRGWEVRGSVRTSEGKPLAAVDVYTCGKRVQTDEDGEFRAVVRGPTCAVRAVYRDGLLSRRSEPVTVGPFDARAVDLTVDEGPIAGMGIAFRMADEGARVLTVHPDTPAEEAGLENGDLIVSVDGTRAAGLSDDAFIALGTGPEGSRVTLEVERGGERVTVSFNRERLESGDTGEGATSPPSRRRLGG